MRALFLAAVISAAALSQATAQDTTTIAAFGDSLFAGFGVAPQEAFPAQLEAKLNKDGHHAHVINDGVSGDTVAGGLARINDVLAQKPSIVIVEFGANDMLRGFPPAQIRDKLDAMLSKFQDAGIRMLIVGQKAPRSYGAAYAKDFDPLFCDLAKKHYAECYPVYLEGVYGNADLMQQDGMHPNAEGVKIAVGRIYPYVARLLKE